MSNIFSKLLKGFQERFYPKNTLDKSICQKCYKENKWKWNWTQATDMHWNERGVIYCPVVCNVCSKSFLPYPILISNIDKNKYLQHCPYYLEHVMSNQ